MSSFGLLCTVLLACLLPSFCVCLADNVNQSAEVRLVGGNNASSGRVEVFHDGVWGTVCHDYLTDTTSTFSINFANAFCRSLGYSSGRVTQWMYCYYSDACPYCAGSGPIWLDDVNCPPDATGWEQCTHRGWGVSNCNHEQDVGISCDSAIRLNQYGYVNMYAGRVEVFHNGTWGSACSDNWTQANTDAFCRSYGFRTGYQSYYDYGTGQIWLDDVICPINATGWEQCVHNGWGVHNCQHYQDVGVSCYDWVCSSQLTTTPTPTNPSIDYSNSTIRLANGPNAASGRVEVWQDGVWGTVCDDGLDSVYETNGANFANAFCRTLGYKYGVDLKCCAYYGDGSGPIWMDDVVCPPDAIGWEECTHLGWGSHNCGHHEDVSISCSNETNATYPNATAFPPTTTQQQIFTTAGAGMTTRGTTTVHQTGTTAVVVPVPAEFLIASDYTTNMVYYVNVTSGEYKSVFTAVLNQPSGLACDFVNHDVYLGDHSGIWRHSLSSGTEAIIHNEGASNFTAMSIDDTNRRLYYTNWSKRRIGDINLGSFQHRFLINTDGQPYGIAVDGNNRMLFWTEELPPSIKRTSLDNLASLETIINTAITRPRGFAADFRAGVLYFGDSVYDKIETCNLDGSNRRVVANEINPLYSGFALTQGIMYITDFNQRCLRKMDLRTSIITDENPCIFSGAAGIAVDGSATRGLVPGCGSVLHKSPNDTYVLPGWSIGCYIDKYNDTVAWQQSCKSMLVDLPRYDTADELLANGGNFGCYASDYVTADVSQACQDNFQQDLVPRYCPPCQMLAVCIRFP